MFIFVSSNRTASFELCGGQWSNYLHPLCIACAISLYILSIFVFETIMLCEQRNEKGKKEWNRREKKKGILM